MRRSRKGRQIDTAVQVIAALGLPPAQHNERTALCLLALLDLTPGKAWSLATSPLLGITPIMDWVAEHYDKTYAPNTRETIRKHSVQQFCDAGVARLNPDDPDRAVNSPKAAYQIDESALRLLRTVDTPAWHDALADYLSTRDTLVERYARERDLQRIPVRIAPGKSITLSPGAHSELIRAIVEEFAERFAPGSELIYVGDTGEKFGYFDAPRLAELGVELPPHGKMPDVVLHFSSKGWLFLIESVTSHGPIDGKRHAELAALFATSKAGLVFVTAFPDRSTMSRYIGTIAWETEIWAADAPSHLIHLNGERLLGPYGKP